MMKLLLVFIFSVLTVSNSWIQTEIENNLVIKFPANPKIKHTGKGCKSYSSNTKNCDFTLSVIDYAGPDFPKNETDVSLLFQEAISKSKERERFIESANLNFGKIKVLELKQYFYVPEKEVRYIKIERLFFLNNKLYTLRALFRNKNEFICQKESDYFFSSLKFKNK